MGYRGDSQFSLWGVSVPQKMGKLTTKKVFIRTIIFSLILGMAFFSRFCIWFAIMYFSYPYIGGSGYVSFFFVGFCCVIATGVIAEKLGLPESKSGMW